MSVASYLNAHPGIKSQVAAVIDHKVEGIKMPVLCKNSAAGKKAVRVIDAGSRPHEDLPHVFKMPASGKLLRQKGRRRILQALQEKGIDEPGAGVFLLRHDLLNITGKGRGLRKLLPIEVPDIRHVREKL